MFGLDTAFKAAGKYIDDGRKYNRMIEREQLLVDPKRIVLVHDFMACFRKPAPVGKRKTTHIGRLGTKRETRFDRVLEAVINTTPDAEMFLIPENLMTEESRAALPAGPDKAFMKEMLAEMLSQVFGESKDQIEAQLPEPQRFAPATWLGGLLHCWNKVASFDRAKQVSLFLGEGRPMLDFWSAVKDLSSYNHLLPNKTMPIRFNTPSGPHPTHSGGRKKAWKPATAGLNFEG